MSSSRAANSIEADRSSDHTDLTLANTTLKGSLWLNSQRINRQMRTKADDLSEVIYPTAECLT